MKKLFFIFGLGISTLSFANTKQDLTEISKPQMQSKKMFPVTFSCGITLNYEVGSGVSTGALLSLIWYYDSILCGN
jgi:hypothetical protein